MKCPGCSERVLGLDCEKCGRTFEPRCPGCHAWFTTADRFCGQCGRDLTWVNFHNRVMLRFPIGLIPEEYEYPPERSGLKLLRKTGPLRDLTRLYIRRLSEPMFHGALLGSSVKVTEKQFPRIRRVAATCERILGLPPVNIFIGQNPPDAPTVTAFTYGTEESCCIFLTAGLVDSMSESELRFVIGHEMGHIKSHHVLYLTIANSIAYGLPALGGDIGAWIGNLARLFITPWQRKAEITGDRAGLICCQSLGTAIRTMVKISLGTKNLFTELDLEEYLKQGQTLKEKYSWAETQSGHPYIINRVQLLSEFYHSSELARVLQTAYDPRCPKIFCPRCRAHDFFDDTQRKLKPAACRRCREPLGLEKIVCPHCHVDIELKDGDTLAILKCKACEKIYLDGLPPARSPVEPPNHYDRLGLVESASDFDIDRAYVDHMRATQPAGASGDTSVRRRVTLTTAFRALSDRSQRAAYDRGLRVRRALHFARDAMGIAGPIESLPTCEACGMPRAAKHCAQCGKAA